MSFKSLKIDVGEVLAPGEPGTYWAFDPNEVPVDFSRGNKKHSTAFSLRQYQNGKVLLGLEFSCDVTPKVDGYFTSYPEKPTIFGAGEKIADFTPGKVWHYKYYGRKKQFYLLRLLRVLSWKHPRLQAMYDIGGASIILAIAIFLLQVVLNPLLDFVFFIVAVFAVTYLVTEFPKIFGRESVDWFELIKKPQVHFFLGLLFCFSGVMNLTRSVVESGGDNSYSGVILLFMGFFYLFLALVSKVWLNEKLKALGDRIRNLIRKT